jgi:hypothetical protein
MAQEPLKEDNKANGKGVQLPPKKKRRRRGGGECFFNLFHDLTEYFTHLMGYLMII